MKTSRFNQILAALQAQRVAASDDIATATAALYPTLKGSGALIPNGTRINWNGSIKKAAVDLWDYPENAPDKASNLWADIVYQGEYRTIPEVITVALAFALGERGWWKGVLYESLRAANVYTPDQYAAGWKKVT